MKDFLSHRQTTYSIEKSRLIENAEQLKEVVLEILKERRAVNVEVFESHPLAQYVIIAEHFMEPTLRATANHISYTIKKSSKYSANCEGMRESSWIIVDLEDVIVHLFTEESRSRYMLSDLLKQNLTKTESAPLLN